MLTQPTARHRFAPLPPVQERRCRVTVTITCVTQYTISAHVVGSAGTVVLQDNGADNLTVSTAGTSTTPFATKVAAGGAYAVTVLTQPTARHSSAPLPRVQEPPTPT